MKRLLFFTLIGILCASVAFGQGSIMVFSDPAATSCNFTDVGGLVQVYVWHMFTTGATASEWMLDVTNVGWARLADLPEFDLVIGTSVSGVLIGYEACLQGNFQLMTVDFFGSNADPCGLIGIVAAPAKYGVRSRDCNDNFLFIPGGQGRVNPDYTCWCAPPPDSG
jgi:hypothetical protein